MKRTEIFEKDAFSDKKEICRKMRFEEKVSDLAMIVVPRKCFKHQVLGACVRCVGR